MKNVTLDTDGHRRRSHHTEWPILEFRQWENKQDRTEYGGTTLFQKDWTRLHGATRQVAETCNVATSVKRCLTCQQQATWLEGIRNRCARVHSFPAYRHEENTATLLRTPMWQKAVTCLLTCRFVKWPVTNVKESTSVRTASKKIYSMVTKKPVCRQNNRLLECMRVIFSLQEDLLTREMSQASALCINRTKRNQWQNTRTARSWASLQFLSLTQRRGLHSTHYTCDETASCGRPSFRKDGNNRLTVIDACRQPVLPLLART